MCTLVLLRRPGHRWPVLIAANRDEMVDRPWDPPAAHWPDRPDVVAGRDRLAGGSWLGYNASGVVAAILNRTDSLGPAAGKRSRGELVLDALDHDDAGDAAAALAAIDPAAYRTFNLVIADNRDAYWLRSRDGRSPVEAVVMPAGLSMLTSANLNDTQNFRIAAYLPRFTEATPPDPDTGDWSSWRSILGSRQTRPEAGPSGAMSIVTDYGYGTVSSSLIALAAPDAKFRQGVRDIWLFAKGRPDEADFAPVDLPA
jgi:hypothetical protein